MAAAPPLPTLEPLSFGAISPQMASSNLKFLKSQENRTSNCSTAQRPERRHHKPGVPRFRKTPPGSRWRTGSLGGLYLPRHAMRPPLVFSAQDRRGTTRPRKALRGWGTFALTQASARHCLASRFLTFCLISVFPLARICLLRQIKTTGRYSV